MDDDLFSMSEHQDVRILVVQKDKIFRYDVADPRRDYLVKYSLWQTYLISEINALKKSKDNWAIMCVDGTDILCHVFLHNGQINNCGDMTGYIISAIPDLKVWKGIGEYNR